jgi:hypothetical protein
VLGILGQHGRAAAGLSVASEVTLLVNGRARATANSNAAGRYTKKLKGAGKRSVFQARVDTAARDLSAAGCAEPTQAGIACVSATAGSFTAASRKVTVRF